MSRSVTTLIISWGAVLCSHVCSCGDVCQTPPLRRDKNKSTRECGPVNYHAFPFERVTYFCRSVWIKLKNIRMLSWKQMCKYKSVTFGTDVRRVKCVHNGIVSRSRATALEKPWYYCTNNGWMYLMCNFLTTVGKDDFWVLRSRCVRDIAKKSPIRKRTA